MIATRTEGRLTLLTLDRPDKANALTAEMLEALVAAVRQAAGQSVLILTGRGTVFSAGADLDAAKAGLATSPLWEDLSGAIAEFGGLSIAALNGTCAGGACGMMLACDLRVAVPSARIFYPVARLGYLPQPSDPPRLTRLAGLGLARRVLLAGERIDAAEAHRVGLVDRIADDALAASRDMAATALEADPAHLAAIKAMI